jgi:hypothetical protein
LNRVGLEYLGVEKPYERLFIPSFAKLDAAYKKSKTSQFTVKIEDSVKLMSNSLSAIYGIVPIMLRDVDNSIVASAKNIEFLLNPYRGINKKARKDFLADVENLLQDLNGANPEDIAKLGLDKYISELEANYVVVDGYEESRTREKSDKRKRDSVEAKTSMVDAYRAICKIVEVGILTDGEEKFDIFVNDLNTIIAEISGGSSSSSSSDKTETITPPANEEEVVDEGDDEIDEEEELTNEEKYPDAKAWVEGIKVADAKNGDIFYVIVGGEKVFYKLVDYAGVGFAPGGTKYQECWEKL